MKLLLDMNISPVWRDFLSQAGHDCVHWMEVGDPRADDQSLLAWAKREARVVFTHDLDFGAILAATDAEAPSVFQIRWQNLTPVSAGTFVVDALHRFKEALDSGALVTLDPIHARVRILPLSRPPSGR